MSSKDLAEHHDISPKRAASLLDIFSCISQGLVPYGAQALLLGAQFRFITLRVVIPELLLPDPGAGGDCGHSIEPPPALKLYNKLACDKHGPAG